MRMNLLSNTTYWAVLISLSSYLFTKYLQERKKWIMLNPLLISTLLTILFLFVFNVDYEKYSEKANFLSYLLTPATVCLAVPLYEQIKPLKANLLAIVLGISSGIIACLLSVLGFSILFKFSHEMYVTLLPKSITAAMAMGVSNELGGISSLTVPIVITTGITGNIIAEFVCKTFNITDPVAKGLAIGTSSHAMGTVKAIEMGEVEGAISSLSIAVAGILTVIGSTIFSKIY